MSIYLCGHHHHLSISIFWSSSDSLRSWNLLLHIFLSNRHPQTEIYFQVTCNICVLSKFYRGILCDIVVVIPYIHPSFCVSFSYVFFYLTHFDKFFFHFLEEFLNIPSFRFGLTVIDMSIAIYYSLLPVWNLFNICEIFVCLTLEIQRKFIKFYKIWTGVACISFTNYFGDSSREQSRWTISNDDGSTFFRLSVTAIFNIPQLRLDLHKFSYNTCLHWYLDIIGLINQHNVWNYPQVEKRRYLFTEKITLSVF